jgi:hypothetical protein
LSEKLDLRFDILLKSFPAVIRHKVVAPVENYQLLRLKNNLESLALELGR